MIAKDLNKLSKVCKDYTKIENYELAINDETQTWDCHHRLETHFSDGTPRPINARLSMDELVTLGVYWNRLPEELIFMTHKDHLRLHRKGIPLSEEQKQKYKGCQKGRKRSEEAKRRISEGHKGRNTWTKGTYYYNNGTINVRTSECPEGFKPGRLKFHRSKHSEETKRKISKTSSGRHKGKHWYTNGIVNVISFTCPEGFISGMLKRS